jgi:glycerol-3-phosphate cytidylyltransferase-like family protein
MKLQEKIVEKKQRKKVLKNCSWVGKYVKINENYEKSRIKQNTT